MTDNGRLAVAKTYKLYVGGAFPRSESGRSYPVTDASGSFLANAAQGSRKDARDAVTAARSAFAGWSGATAYNRGQVLYRVAEVMEGRRGQFVDEVSAAEGLSGDDAGRIVFEVGVCELDATRTDALVLTAKAEDDERLERLQHVVASHLERFGKRDELAVSWAPAA